MTWLLLACAEEPVAEASSCTADANAELVVVRTIELVIADDAGVSDGFNLDGAVSSDGGSSGCGIGDYVSPGGVEGIDNNFSRLVPTLETTEAKVETIEGLIQSAIDSGELLISFELGGVDSWENDECVSLSVGQATGDAMLGTDGLLLDGQTFDPDPGAAVTEADDGRITDGTFTTTGVATDIPAQILNAYLTLPIRSGAVSITPQGDDLYAGFLGGGVATSYLQSVAETENVDPVVAELLGTVLSYNADLDDPDEGECKALSMTLAFEAVGAYWYGD
ncbi:MAG: hypothetical protein FJ102_18210 [Deltaproteobacteria bacterium]|nr:hypothetical protein [Deltaproteobacteria bacterium]